MPSSASSSSTSSMPGKEASSASRISSSIGASRSAQNEKTVEGTSASDSCGSSGVFLGMLRALRSEGIGLQEQVEELPLAVGVACDALGVIPHAHVEVA